MEALVQQLLVDFPQDPGTYSRSIRQLADDNWVDFLPASLSVLADGGLSHGASYLVSLLLRENALADALCDPALLTVEAAAAVAKIAVAVERRFGVDLVRRLTSLDPTEQTQAERLLKIVEEVLDSMIVRPNLVPLLSHFNGRLRSKAALLVGRMNKSPQLASSQVSDLDARVRANAVEALWGVEDPACEAIFCKAACDRNQRVAANGAIGLYSLQKVCSIQLLHQLAERPMLECNVSAIWAMGKIASPRFQPVVSQAMLSGGSKLRLHALRSLARIRQTIRASEMAGAFSVSLSLDVNSDEPLTKLLLTASQGPEAYVSHLSPMDFLVLEGKRLLQDYAVVEHPAPAAVAVGFLVPAILPGAGAAVLASLNHKRPRDQFCVQHYEAKMPASSENPNENRISTRIGILGLVGPATERVFAPVHFTGDAETLEQSIAGVTALRDFAGALQSIMEAASVTDGVRHILCIYDDCLSFVTADEFRNTVVQARKMNIFIDAIGPAQGAAASFFEALCRDTGGVLYRVSGHDEIPSALERVRLSAVNHYEVSFQRTNPDAHDVTVRLWSPRGCGEATIRQQAIE